MAQCSRSFAEKRDRSNGDVITFLFRSGRGTRRHGQCRDRRVTLDLFDMPVLPGLRTQSGLVDADEERMLIDRIDASGPTPFRFQGWEGKRLTTSFGWNYDFDAGQPREAPPIPDWLRPFRERAATFAGLDADELIQALLIRYDIGAGIGWHRDRPIYGQIVGISLGAPAAMRFRRRRAEGFDRVSAPLEPRAAYHMSGLARHEWEHSIVEMEQPRWSITFRSLAPRR
jgi:alkylated DNA repair dioxygenase AlkB